MTRFLALAEKGKTQEDQFDKGFRDFDSKIKASSFLIKNCISKNCIKALVQDESPRQSFDLFKTVLFTVVLMNLVKSIHIATILLRQLSS